jgi:hypothetical protein
MREILILLEKILRRLERIERELFQNHHTQHIGVLFYGKDPTQMNALVMTVGQKSVASIVPLEADGVTVTPGAVVSAQALNITDPSFSVTPNGDGTFTIAALAPNAGTAPVSGTATATVVDAGGTTGTFSVPITIQVNAPTGVTAGIGVNFTTPA